MCLNLRRHARLLWAFLLTGGVTIMLACAVQADSISSAREGSSIRDKGLPSTGRDDAETPSSSSVALGVAVRHVKLQPDEPIEGAETSTLVFDVYNGADSSITDVVVSVSFLEATAGHSKRPRIIVGPFEIRLKQVLLADYSVHYELRLRNLSSDCSCVPAIEVLDARVLVGSTLESTLPLR